MKKNILFIIWFFLISIPSIYMMAQHQPLLPSKNQKIKQIWSTDANWTLLHFVNPDCGCSEKVVTKLKARKSRQGEVTELVVILGENKDWETGLNQMGYNILEGKMDDFSEKFSINAVPQFVILNSKKEILYSGGYSSQRGLSSRVEDDLIFQEVLEKNQTKERPIFGCVNGKNNQQIVDTLGLKYGK